MQGEAISPGRVIIRTSLEPGDIGSIVQLHDVVCAREYGFDSTFEVYVAGPLAAFVYSASPRERLWIAERERRIIGCNAIVAGSPDTAQLRWFLVEPSARDGGLGRRLLVDAVAFCRDCGYGTIILWTVSALAMARHLYRSAGFRKVEARPGRMWGVDVVEEKYQLAPVPR